MVVFIAEKKKAAKLPSASDGCENEVEFLSKQLKDLSVHHSSEQCHSSATQNEKHFPGAISDISNDDSLQDIIDFILPCSSNDHPSHSLEKLSPFAKMDDAKWKFSDAAIGINSSDNEDVCNDDDDDVFAVGGDDVFASAAGDDDDDDIPCDSKPLQTEFKGDNLNLEKELETLDDSETLKPLKLKGAKNPSDFQDVLDCIDMDDYYYDGDDSNIAKSAACPPASLERKEQEELQPITSSGSQIVSKSSDTKKGHEKNAMCTQRQSVKPSRVKTVLNDAELIEIFGSSDEEDDNKSLFKLKQSSFTTKLKGGKRATRLDGLKSRNQVPDDVFDSLDAIKCPQRPLQQVKRGFSSDTDHNNALVENCSKVINKSKDCLSSVLQEGSCAKSNARLSKINVNVSCAKGTERNDEELARATRKVLESATTILNKPSQSSVQWFDSYKTEKCDSVDDIHSHGSSGKLQGHESLKENTDSPFNDYMPAPLSKRLGKHFSAKQRLASLHSISSATDDI